ncbi:hypothetical protein QYF61_006852 [Mycteria americana]|uniref:Reverse transcriptase domain-containing protein n=1 Tax=Mycteria americana TaxID=33587 RepID=A0AAN7NQP6_MYCAM|nr:hypothetical protein QYF61_006852 [Mycteria americana]
MNNKKIIRRSQHGFTKGKSCLTNLINFCGEMATKMIKGLGYLSYEERLRQLGLFRGSESAASRVTVPSTRVHTGVPACPVQQHRNSSDALAICQPRRIAIAVIKMFPGTAEALSNLTLNVSRDGASITSLGNLFQCFTTLIAKKFLPYISSLNLPSFSLKQLPLVLSQQALLKREVFQPSDHFCGPPLDLLQQVHVLLVLRTPELSTVLQPRIGLAFWHRAGSCPAFHPPAPQVLLHRAALNPFIPQPVLIPGVAPTQVQEPALGLVKPHEVHTRPLLQLVQVPLDGLPSLRYVNCTTQLGVICKLAEGALNPTVYVLMKILNTTGPNTDP